MVTAGGSTEFLIDRTCFDSDDHDNGLVLMQLLMMTEKGCEASAEFWLMSGTDSCGSSCGAINGGLFYACDILITDTAVNLRPKEIVAGTAAFVSTGEIKLITAP